MELVKMLVTTEIERSKEFADGTSERQDIINQIHQSLMPYLEFIDEDTSLSEKAEILEEVQEAIRNTRKKLAFLRQHPNFSGNNLLLNVSIEAMEQEKTEVMKVPDTIPAPMFEEDVPPTIKNT